MRATYKLYILLLMMFIGIHVFGQEFSGYVKEKGTNEPLPGVVVILNSKEVAYTDSIGFFRFTSDVAQPQVTFYQYGFQTKTRALTSTSSEIFLSPLQTNLDEVTVTAYRQVRGNNRFMYSLKDIKKQITLVGEPDIMRYIQVLPGVSQGMEGGMGFYVRGGGNGNNRVELDGVSVSAPTHLFGLFSSFHSDIVEQTSFQMGGISASSGDLLSSLMHIQTVTPAKDKYKGSLSLSPLMLGGSLQGYIVKDKLSFQVAGRTSLLRPIFLLAKKASDMKDDFNPQIIDAYAKLHWQVNEKHSLDLSGYASKDYFSFKPEIRENTSNFDMEIGWNNRMAKLAWKYQINPRWKMETFAYHTHFDTKQGQNEYKNDTTTIGMIFGSGKQEWGVRGQLFYNTEKLTFNSGIDFRKQTFTPNVKRVLIKKTDQTTTQHHTQYSSIGTVFAESQYAFTESLKVKGGIRYNLYKAMNDGIKGDLELRLFSSYAFTPNVGIELTLDQLTQFQHTLEGLPIGWALDLIVPASGSFKPEKARQLYLGGYWGNRNFYATIGGYYKQLDNLVWHKNMINFLSSPTFAWDVDAVKGKGKSYGLEVWLERRNKRWNGSLAYTLSRTTRQFDGLNQGKTFPFKFDRTHNLNLQSQYIVRQTAKHMQSFNTAVYFTSGNNITLPVASYKGVNLPYWDETVIIPPMEKHHATVRTQMTGINGFRLPN